MDLTPVHGHQRSRARVYMNLDPYRNDPLTAPRSTATYQRVRRETSPGFKHDLGLAQTNNHVVQKGDTLSQIVQNRLRQTGQPASGADLYTHVREVARANGIVNPDVISIGQTIDLTTLDGRGGPAIRSHAHSDPHCAAPDDSLTPSQLDNLVAGNARISSGFGPRQDPFDGSVRDHRGIDIAARRGTPIFPAKDGTVVHAGWHGGHGKTVILRHDDKTETLYGHADQLFVNEGQRVRTTDKLGLVGSTGRSTGPHLHFEVRINGTPVDPLAALR